MQPDFSTTPEMDFSTQRVLADVATSELDTRLEFTEHVEITEYGVSREFGFAFVTPELADLVTVLPMPSLRVLRDALTAVVEGAGRDVA